MSRVLQVLETLKMGKFVIVTDDESREDEGDLVVLAELICPEKINFMAKEGRGLICLALAGSIVDQLELPMMVDSSKERPLFKTPFTVSIEARQGVTTGISASDRAKTIQVAVSKGASPSDIVVPGHIFPLRCAQEGLKERQGHTEASVELAILSESRPAAVICEILNENGGLLRGKGLLAFSIKHEIPMVSVAEIIQFIGEN